MYMEQMPKYEVGPMPQVFGTNSAQPLTHQLVTNRHPGASARPVCQLHRLGVEDADDALMWLLGVIGVSAIQLALPQEAAVQVLGLARARRQFLAGLAFIFDDIRAGDGVNEFLVGRRGLRGVLRGKTADLNLCALRHGEGSGRGGGGDSREDRKSDQGDDAVLHDGVPQATSGDRLLLGRCSRPALGATPGAPRNAQPGLGRLARREVPTQEPKPDRHSSRPQLLQRNIALIEEIELGRPEPLLGAS